MKTENLDLISIARGSGATHVIEVSADDLTEKTANTSQAVEIFKSDKPVLVEVVASISNGLKDTDDPAFNSTALTIGVSGAASALLASQEINANASGKVLTKAGAGKAAYEANKGIIATFASMSGKKLADLDAGKVVILLKVVSLPEYAELD